MRLLCIEFEGFEIQPFAIKQFQIDSNRSAFEIHPSKRKIRVQNESDGCQVHVNPNNFNEFATIDLKSILKSFNTTQDEEI